MGVYYRIFKLYFASRICTMFFYCNEKKGTDLTKKMS